MDQAELLSGRALAGYLAVKQERKHRYLRHRWQNALALVSGDTLALSFALSAVNTVSYFWLEYPLLPLWIWYLIPAWWFGAGFFSLLPSWGLGPVEEARRLTVLVSILFASAAVVLFLSKQGEAVSRLTVSMAFLISLPAIPLVRLQIKRILIAYGRWGIPTVIYGAGQSGTYIARFLQEERGLGYMPVGMLDDNEAYWGTSIEKVRVLGSTDLVMPHVPVAILAMPHVDRKRKVELLEGPLSYYRTVLLIPDLLEVPSLWIRPRDLNGTLGLEITHNLSSPLAQFTKRAVDVLLVLLSAPLWVPLCLLLALLIWLEDGQHPVYFQQRVGKGKRLFKTWKLRTMVPNAEEVLQRKLAEDPALRQEWETCYKLKKDPRITRIGKFLRRFSLDELLQLINVLKGEMSLVGPRPLPLYHHEELPNRARELRERVRPGLTGFWQVSGRSETGTEGMERWDCYYVRNWSLWLDVVVLVRTWRAVIDGTGAY